VVVVGCGLEHFEVDEVGVDPGDGAELPVGCVVEEARACDDRLLEQLGEDADLLAVEEREVVSLTEVPVLLIGGAQCGGVMGVPTPLVVSELPREPFDRIDRRVLESV
jgi:hypothetical protein